MKRKINKIIVHCSATPPRMDIGVEEIRRWHKERGWSDIGYHYVICRDGHVEAGRDVEKAGAHTKGHNRDSIGICLIGGVDDEGKPCANFTNAQWGSLASSLRFIRALCGDNALPIYGHNDFTDKKACPSFDVGEWLAKMGLQ